jgi:dTDP-4-dehydrorhamnose reductase
MRFLFSNTTFSKPHMATILVTGADGQLGSELRERAPAHPEHRFVFYNRTGLDINDPQKINACFAAQQPQYCINCAAYTAVDKAETDRDSAYQTNATAVKNLAAACAQFHVRFIHISTDYVFDGRGTMPYSETAATNPSGVYGQSKLQGEHEALQANAETLIVRTSWVYSQYGHNFVKTMLRLMQSRTEIGVVADQQGSPTYAADLAEALLHVIDSGIWQPGVYHFSNAGVVTWHGFAQAIKEATGAACLIKPITTAEYPTPAARPAYSVLNTEKIQQVYGIRLKPWRESLLACLRKLAQVAQA